MSRGLLKRPWVAVLSGLFLLGGILTGVLQWSASHGPPPGARVPASAPAEDPPTRESSTQRREPSSGTANGADSGPGATGSASPDSDAPDSNGAPNVVRALVHGKVTDAQGRAIADAEVRVSTTARTETTSSGTDGAFELPLTWEFGMRLPSVTAVHPRFMPARETIYFPHLKERLARLEKDLVLEDGIALMGRAVSSGRPAAGAVVRIVRDKIDRGILYWAASDGRFFIPLQGESRLDLTINHGQLGYAERSYRCDRKATFDVGDVELSRCSVLSVRLVYPDGTGITGVPIKIVSCETGILETGRGAAIWRGTTDQGGSLTLHGMEPGRHDVLVQGLLRSGSARKPNRHRIGTVSTDDPPATLRVAMHRVRLSFRLESGEAVPPESVALLWTEASEDASISNSENADGKSKPASEDPTGDSRSTGGISISHRNTNMTGRFMSDRFIEYDSRWRVIAETLTKDGHVGTQSSTLLIPIPGINESRVDIVLRKVKED